MNLATALAEGEASVCLIEADLRRPTLAKSLGLIGDVGLTTAIVGKTALDDALQAVGRNLTLLTSGVIPPNPSELLASHQAQALIRTIADRFDYVIIDTAPLLPVVDAAEISTIADATILVHRAGRTTKVQAERAVLALGRVGTKPVGVILNMITRGIGSYDYAYGYYYEYRPNRSRSIDREPVTTAALAAP